METLDWQGRLCPLCAGGVLDTEATCRWCAAPLTHPAALRAFEADDALAELRAEYASLRARWDSVVHDKAAAAAALREAAIAAAPLPVTGAAPAPTAPASVAAVTTSVEVTPEPATAPEQSPPTPSEPHEATRSVATALDDDTREHDAAAHGDHGGPRVISRRWCIGHLAAGCSPHRYCWGSPAPLC